MQRYSMTPKQTKIVLAVASVSLVAALALVIYYYFVTNVKQEEIDMYEMKHFDWNELTKSDIAKAHGLDNSIPNDEIRDNLLALVMKVLDPLRDMYGKEIYISSAFRTPEVNRLAKGQASSQHLKGQAADITTRSKEGNKKLYELIQKIGEYDQLINENDYSWIHVSYKRIGYNRKSAFKLP